MDRPAAPIPARFSVFVLEFWLLGLFLEVENLGRINTELLLPCYRKSSCPTTSSNPLVMTPIIQICSALVPRQAIDRMESLIVQYLSYTHEK